MKNRTSTICNEEWYQIVCKRTIYFSETEDIKDNKNIKWKKIWNARINENEWTNNENHIEYVEKRKYANKYNFPKPEIINPSLINHVIHEIPLPSELLNHIRMLCVHPATRHSKVEKYSTFNRVRR